MSAAWQRGFSFGAAVMFRRRSKFYGSAVALLCIKTRFNAPPKRCNKLNDNLFSAMIVKNAQKQTVKIDDYNIENAIKMCYNKNICIKAIKQSEYPKERCTESPEIAFGEVRLYVPRPIIGEDLPARGKSQYPRTFSALRSSRGAYSHMSVSRISPEAKWNSVVDAFALTEKSAKSNA